jgi:hypothetical protein
MPTSLLRNWITDQTRKPHMCVTQTESANAQDSTIFTTLHGDPGRSHQFVILPMREFDQT